MADPHYNLKEHPEYDREIPALTTATPAHAETAFRPVFESLLNNTEYVRQLAEAIAADVEALTPGDIGAAVVEQFTATLPTTGWSGSDPYTIALSVPGLVESTPAVGPILDSDIDLGDQQQEAWNCIYAMEAKGEQLVVTCVGGTPAVAVPFQIQVVRGGS